MSTLKVNKLRDTAGSADAIVLDPNGGAVLAGVTTVTSVKVGAAVTISESGIEASGIGITCANINGTQIGGRRNIVINGAMQVAQYGTSSTSAGYQTVDRYSSGFTGMDEAPTFAQHALTSSDSGPYEQGFRHSLHVTNGNQTGGAGAGDDMYLIHNIEGQDVAKSGWDYVSSSSFITLSFWVKASVSQTYYFTFRGYSTTNKEYAMSVALTANTWTKVVRTIPGNSDLSSVPINNAKGWHILWYLWWGTNYTTPSGPTLNAWVNKDNNNNLPDLTTTWITTNDSTYEITGLQLEAGSQATPFEHRSMGDELLLCQRYYFKLGKQDYLGTHMAAGEIYGIGMSDNDNVNIYGMINFPVRMRQPPTAIDQSGSAGDYRVRRDTSKTCTGVPTFVDAAEHYCRVNFPSSSHGWGTGQMLWCQSAGSSGYLGFSAEL